MGDFFKADVLDKPTRHTPAKKPQESVEELLTQIRDSLRKMEPDTGDPDVLQYFRVDVTATAGSQQISLNNPCTSIRLVANLAPGRNIDIWAGLGHVLFLGTWDSSGSNVTATSPFPFDALTLEWNSGTALTIWGVASNRPFEFSIT